MLYQSLIDAIGNTPLIRLKNIEEKYNLKGKIYAKFEASNPVGSAKDRAALGMIKAALKEGEINKDSILIEPTSGNTGISMAAIAASLGMKAIVVMPDNMSIERQKMMKVFGTKVVLTPGALGMTGAVEMAQKIKSENDNAMILGQFDNIYNRKEHYNSTGPEIYRDLNGAVDCYVATVGTGGTFSGVAEYLKEKNKNIYCVAVEPEASPLLSKGIAGSHKIQGIGANFVPDNFREELADEIITVRDEDSFEMFSVLPKTEGLFGGISSGASLVATIKVAQREEFKGKNIVFIMTDTGERYLSVIANE